MPSLLPRALPVRIVRPGLDDRDVLVHLADPDVRVDEVVEALGLGGAACSVDGVSIDGLSDVGAGRQPAIDALVPGAIISVGSAESCPADELPEPVVELSIVAGLDAGASTRLPVGRYRLDGLTRTGDAAGGLYCAIDRHDLAACEPQPWHRVGGSVEAVSGPGVTVGLGMPVDRPPGHRGFVHRPPRQFPPTGVPPIVRHAPPKPVGQPAALSWATLLGPIPVALVMAVFFRPIFALFAAMGPVVALGRWFEARRRHRRDVRTRELELAELRSSLHRQIGETLEAEARRRWVSQPHVAELLLRAQHHSARLWERRPGSPGHLRATLGIGVDRWPVPSDGVPHDDELHEPLREPHPLRAVPHVVDLETGLGLGLHGDRTAARAVARSVLLQLATLHGPADLRIGLITSADRIDDWDWLKWLPHLEPGLIATSAAAAAEAFAPAAAAPAAAPGAVFRPGAEVGEVSLMVIDDPTADVAVLHRAATAAGVTLRILAVAPRPTMLPASCTTLVELDGDRAVISTPHVAVGETVVRATGVSAETAQRWSIAMASMRDPERIALGAATTAVPPTLLGLVGGADIDRLSTCWSQRPPAQEPIAWIGESSDGPFSLNLVDDGPHALVAGTTGSGKSELLRTFVLSLAASCPPDHLQFVLVDFKGGGAFDVCDRLPHIAGLITDLDEALVARAISSLGAELHRREALFRTLGASSYAEAVRASRAPIPRLVVVIDEFAALATDYPELLSSIIDLAARGRSLGMHLVLATQRPNGVVDQKIRANTNLRIALRVQDPFDSQDVIGTPDAAGIDRRTPGRAIVSIGGDMPVSIQTAWTGAPDRRSHRCDLQPHVLRVRGASRPGADERRSECEGQSVPPATELTVLVEAIAAAAQRRAVRAESLWPDPLPETLDWIDLGARLLAPDAAGHGLAVGLVDLPDRQTQRPWRWNLDDGALAIYGASSVTTGRALTTVAAAAASTMSPEDLHLYVIDGDAGACESIARLNHTGAHVAARDADRADRVIALVEQTLAGRRDTPDRGAPRVLLMVENLAGLLAGRDELASMQLVDRLAALARDGAAQRVHLVVTARTPRDLSHRLAQQIPVRLAAALADPTGYLTLGLTSSQVVPLPAMRCIDLGSGRVVQLAEPPDLTDLGRREIVDRHRAPVPVLSFPSNLRQHELPPGRLVDDHLVVPLGVDAERVAPLAAVFGPGDHLLVVGPAGTGRTSVLDLVEDRLAGVDVDVLRLSPGHEPTRLSELEGIQRRTVVLVDDADRLDDAASADLASAATSASPLVNLVVATTPEHARGIRASVSFLRTHGLGLILGGTMSDGDVFKVKRSPLSGLGSVTGRAHYIERGRVHGMQLATTSEPREDHRDGLLRPTAQPNWA